MKTIWTKNKLNIKHTDKVEFMTKTSVGDIIRFDIGKSQKKQFLGTFTFLVDGEDKYFGSGCRFKNFQDILSYMIGKIQDEIRTSGYVSCLIVNNIEVEVFSKIGLII